MKTAFISEVPSRFAKAVNALVAKSQLGLEIGPVTFSAGKLAAVVTETMESPSMPGTVIEVKTLTGSAAKVTGELAALQNGNPCWRPVVAFGVEPAKAGGDAADADTGKSAIIAVVKLVQP